MPKGVLLVNLGSPDSFAIKDIKRYLKEFLMDECVIDLPYIIRKTKCTNFQNEMYIF